jgi:hypothetical protein
VLAAVSDIILKHMLRRPREREDALTIRTYWINRNIASDNTRPSASTAAPSPQPTPAAPLHSQTATDPSRAGPPPPPPTFDRPSTIRPELASRPPTTGSARSSVRTQEVTITIQQIAEHLRRPQTLQLRLSRSRIKPETKFPGLSPTLKVLGPRNHVRCLPLKPSPDGLTRTNELDSTFWWTAPGRWPSTKRKPQRR